MQHSISEEFTEGRLQFTTALSKHKQKGGMKNALLTMESGTGGCGANKWIDEESSPCYDLKRMRKLTSVHWANNPDESDSSSSGSSCSIISDSIISENNGTQLDANNSGQGIDMINMPSAAETAARQKSWMQIYFRYRIQWHQAKRYLERMSRPDAYKPENLNLWTRYVKVSQHRKVPFLHSVRAFRNRIQCPGIQVHYTLNSFYKKGSETEKAKNGGPLHPIMLPLFRSPDDIAEFKKLPIAIINVFVTQDDSFFDEFWKECATGTASQ